MTKINSKQEVRKIGQEVCFSFLDLWDSSVSISKVKFIVFIFKIFFKKIMLVLKYNYTFMNLGYCNSSLILNFDQKNTLLPS